MLNAPVPARIGGTANREPEEDRPTRERIVQAGVAIVERLPDMD